MVGNHGRPGFSWEQYDRKKVKGKGASFTGWTSLIQSIMTEAYEEELRIFGAGLSSCCCRVHRVYQTRNAPFVYPTHVSCQIILVSPSSGEGIVPVCVWLLREGILGFGREGWTDDTWQFVCFKSHVKLYIKEKL